ncbi:hypothetical protein, partial [Aromatoleum sp.]|uniref:hypothetical protein n=1 Tax=Aromatoleum sp. TaxID=2307007 RepID=UPI002FCB078E
MNAAPLVQPGAFAGDATVVAAPGRAAVGVRAAVDAPPAGMREAGADLAAPVVPDPLLAATSAPLFADLMRDVVGIRADAAPVEGTAEGEEVPVVVAGADGVVDGFAGAALAPSFVPVGFASRTPSDAAGGEQRVAGAGAATGPAVAPVRAPMADITRVVVAPPDVASVAPLSAEPVPGALERLAIVERAAAAGDRGAASP